MPSGIGIPDRVRPIALGQAMLALGISRRDLPCRVPAFCNKVPSAAFPSDVSRLVGAHYEIGHTGNLVFIDEMHEFYAFDPGHHEGVRFECGLSSLEYDPYHARLYLLTSFETKPHGYHAVGLLSLMSAQPSCRRQRFSMVSSSAGP